MKTDEVEHEQIMRRMHTESESEKDERDEQRTKNNNKRERLVIGNPRTDRQTGGQAGGQTRTSGNK